MKEIFLVSNVDARNRIVMPSDPGQKQLNSSRQWHTDSSYKTLPSIGSLLHGIEISRTGGITQFINMYMVYDELPEPLRRQVEGRKARHDFAMLSRLTGAPAPSGAERAAVPTVWHPMVRRHPESGRETVYVSPSYTVRFDGWTEEESRPLLQYLFDHSERPQFVYRHNWRVFDLVMWDNRCTMHRRDPFDPNSRRIMHRTQIKGESRPVAKQPGSTVTAAAAATNAAATDRRRGLCLLMGVSLC